MLEAKKPMDISQEWEMNREKTASTVLGRWDSHTDISNPVLVCLCVHMRTGNP